MINKHNNPSKEDVKASLLNFKTKYLFDYVDMAGAEPTLNFDLKEILEYCQQIGLKPTIVTNGQLTSVIEPLLPLLDDLILSLHNIGKQYEDAVQVPGSFKNVMNTVEMLKRNNFSFRINCHVYKSSNVDRLKKIVDIAGNNNVKILDFIGFCGEEFTNPTVISYSKSAKMIKKAIDYAVKKYPSLKINVRWMPLCVMKGYEKYVINWHQWIYDKYSWNEASGNNVELKTPLQYEEWIDKKLDLNYKEGKCLNCRNKLICDGINPRYTDIFGTDEFFPDKEGEFITDMMFYRGDK